MFHAWGTVTFDGKPVPAGRVDFFPDATKGNGPQGWSLIKDGRFDTRHPDSQAHAGGPMVIRIEGYDGQSGGFGTPIFKPFEIRLDLPKQEGEHNFEVPASAAKDFVAPPKSKS
jgi:hypothetical protein